MRPWIRPITLIELQRAPKRLRPGSAGDEADVSEAD